MRKKNRKELVASHYAAVHNFDSAALHLQRHTFTLGSKRPRQAFNASVAGIRPMKKQPSITPYVSELPTELYLVVFSHCSGRARKFLLPNGGF